jgi:hypothetical protein
VNERVAEISAEAAGLWLQGEQVDIVTVSVTKIKSRQGCAAGQDQTVVVGGRYREDSILKRIEAVGVVRSFLSCCYTKSWLSHNG